MLIIRLLIFFAVVFFTYYLLLIDNFLHLSIANIVATSHQLKDTKHLLVLGCLPIYIALIIFGIPILAIYFAKAVTRFYKNLNSSIKDPNPEMKKFAIKFVRK